ncbi:uncharacterized protein LOC125539236 isoform X2 [Triticum urartu]|nr:uncharacterized protein LOC125512228 isoform X2 [Triticum urartu]XP_048558594.1 uncharacterized protein LOC125539236 isoform X2 [Triticum urartu]
MADWSPCFVPGERSLGQREEEGDPWMLQCYESCDLDGEVELRPLRILRAASQEGMGCGGSPAKKVRTAATDRPVVVGGSEEDEDLTAEQIDLHNLFSGHSQTQIHMMIPRLLT